MRGAALAHPLVGVIGIIASLAVLTFVVSSSFFVSDDFLNFARVREMSFFTWLNSDLFGHWLPGRKALDAGLGSVWPIPWLAVVLVVVLFVGGSALLVRLGIVQLTEDTRWGNVGGIIYPLTAAVPGTVQWYAGAAQVVPATTFSLVAVCACLGTARSRGGRLLLLLVCAGLGTAAGLLFDERTAVVAAVAPLLLPLRAGVPKLVTRVLQCYAVILPTIAAWYLFQRSLAADSPPTPEAGLATVAVYLLRSLTQGALPSLVGWSTRPTVGPPELLWVVGLVVLIVLGWCVINAASRSRALWALSLFIGTVLASSLPVALVRAGEFGTSGALEPRYSAMAMPIGLMTSAFVLHQAWPAIRRRNWSRRVGAVGGLALALGAIAGLAVLHAEPLGRDSREWAERFNRTADELGVTHFYNAPVPEQIVPSGFYPYTLAAAVLPQLRAGVDTIVTADSAGLVGHDGEVQVVSPEDIGAAVPIQEEGLTTDGSGCRIADADGGRALFQSPVATAGGLHVITVTGRFDTTPLRLLSGTSVAGLRDKTAAIGGSAPIPGSTRWVTTDEFPGLAFIAVDVPPAGRLCMDEVRVGILAGTR